MTTNNSSCGAIIAAHVQTAKAEKDGHQDGAYAAFTKPGFAYARFPLRASPKQIREQITSCSSRAAATFAYLRLSTADKSQPVWGRTPPFPVSSNNSA